MKQVSVVNGQKKWKISTLLPLETPSHPFPCNPIQGPREVGVCASMDWVGGVLLTKWRTFGSVYIWRTQSKGNYNILWRQQELKEKKRRCSFKWKKVVLSSKSRLYSRLVAACLSSPSSVSRKRKWIIQPISCLYLYVNLLTIESLDQHCLLFWLLSQMEQSLQASHVYAHGSPSLHHITIILHLTPNPPSYLVF